MSSGRTIERAAVPGGPGGSTPALADECHARDLVAPAGARQDVGRRQAMTGRAADDAGLVFGARRGYGLVRGEAEPAPERVVSLGAGGDEQAAEGHDRHRRSDRAADPRAHRGIVPHGVWAAPPARDRCATLSRCVPGVLARWSRRSSRPRCRRPLHAHVRAGPATDGQLGSRAPGDEPVPHGGRQLGPRRDRPAPADQRGRR